MELKQIIGFDSGYGFTKATNGDHTAVFPSVAGDVVRADFDNDLIKAGRGHVIELRGREWFYGSHAQRHSRAPTALFARERVEQRDLIELLFCAAMAELGVQGRISLATGLPVDWFADRDDLTAILDGEHAFMVDGQPRTVHVCQVAVIPQPFGSFFDAALDHEGNLINAAFVRGKVGIVDVGTFTTDLALSDGLEYVAKASGSKTVAMSTAWRQVRDGIKARWGLDYELHQIDGILRNGATVTVQGQERDVGDLARAAMANLGQQVLAFVRDRWGSARDFKAIVVTGGGGEYLISAIKEAYPTARALPAAHLGNLRGFHKYALRKFGGK